MCLARTRSATARHGYSNYPCGPKYPNILHILFSEIKECLRTLRSRYSIPDMPLIILVYGMVLFLTVACWCGPALQGYISFRAESALITIQTFPISILVAYIRQGYLKLSLFIDSKRRHWGYSRCRNGFPFACDRDVRTQWPGIVKPVNTLRGEWPMIFSSRFRMEVKHQLRYRLNLEV